MQGKQPLEEAALSFSRYSMEKNKESGRALKTRKFVDFGSWNLRELFHTESKESICNPDPPVGIQAHNAELNRRVKRLFRGDPLLP